MSGPPHLTENALRVMAELYDDWDSPRHVSQTGETVRIYRSVAEAEAERSAAAIGGGRLDTPLPNSGRLIEPTEGRRRLFQRRLPPDFRRLFKDSAT